MSVRLRMSVAKWCDTCDTCVTAGGSQVSHRKRLENKGFLNKCDTVTPL